jgi:diguanylate cyclase (GGDEF)-like protein/PAS domain S-box-containing protein
MHGVPIQGGEAQTANGRRAFRWNSMPAPDPDDAPVPGPDARGALHWREHLLNGLLRVAVVAGAVPALLSVLRAVDSGQWRHPGVALTALAFAGIVAWRTDLGFRVRAWLALLIMYALGLWLLLRVGVATQMYLLACPLMAVLLAGTRTAITWLAVTGVTLVGMGWGLDLQLPIPGLEDQPGVKWINHGANFVFLGALLTLSCAFLLRRLESALEQQRAVSDSLRASEDTLRQIAAQVPGMVYRLRFDRDSQPHYIYASPGAQALFGLTPAQMLADGWQVLRLVHAEDRARLLADLSRAHAEARTFSTEFRVRLADGTEKWIHASSTEVSRGEQGVVHNGIMLDITERKASETLVWQQAHFDALTGLPNRVLLRDRLEQAIAKARLAQHPVALLLIDLDHFKEVNDTLGHDRGDQLLVEAGQRIRGCVKDGDVVARMGGDEFTVVLPQISAPVQADLVAQRIIAALSAPFVLGLERAFVSASVGITLYPSDADSLEGLLKHADQALYSAKDAGRSRFRYFTRTLQEQAQLRMRLATDLRNALHARQLHLVYQPIIDLATGEVHKAEALLRWQHPERGPISPAVFIPIAESTGLIGEIGDWVFLTAVAQVQVWRRMLHPEFQISVNRSPVQFRTDACGQPGWGEHLAALGLPGDSIVVEITEGLLLDNGPGVAEQLLALRAAGLPVSLDDFGTGYSAMAYLQKFDIDFLKIDRSFVSGMNQDETGRALCKAIVVMAHELGMQVIAEGVETAEQHAWLAAAGCDYAQGFLFARPLLPDAFEAWLAQHRALSPAPAPLPAPGLARALPEPEPERLAALVTAPGAL